MDYVNDIIANLNSDKIAVIDNHKEWSYKKFRQHVFAAISYYEQNQVQKVMICLPQGGYAYAFILGAYLAGVTFCPVNTSTPKDRIDYYVDAFNPCLVVSEDNLLEILTGLESVADTLNNNSCVLNGPKNDIAYVIFTSGSTGLPKGVMIKRKGLNTFLRSATRSWGITGDDIYGQFSNLGFDLCMADIFAAIISGATIVPIATTVDKLLPGKLIQKHQITFWHSVPSVIDLLKASNHLHLDILKSLRKISFCGERLFPKQLEALFNVNPDLVVFNTYGPTEITIFCTLIELKSDNYKEHCANTVAIGNTFQGWDIVLNNAEDNIGEIVVVGENIGYGYLDPGNNTSYAKFNTTDGQKNCYFTGDFAQYIGSDLYFMGRKDSQIKHKGNRIDLTEIDYWLREYGCVAAISTYWENNIISFVVINDFTESSIRNYLQSKLPDYYLPQYIIHRKSFPKNGSGKIDINELIAGVELL